MLAFSCNLWCGARILCLGKLWYSFLRLDQIPTFYPLYFEYQEISLESSFNRQGFFVFWVFLLVSLPLGHLHPFCHTTCLIYVNKFTFAKFRWLHIYSLPNGKGIPIPMVSYFFYNYLYISFEFHFQHFIITLFLCWSFSFFTLSFLVNSLFQLPIFVKYHMSLLLEDREAIQLYTLLSVHE